MNNLESILMSGREKLAAIQAKNAESDARANAMHADIERRAREAVMALVLPELHEYVSLDFAYNTISIRIPGAARVSASVRFEHDWVRTPDGEQQYQVVSSAWLRISADETVWGLERYRADEGEIYWAGSNIERYGDLGVALARAVELGDSKEEAEAEAERQREPACDGGNDEKIDERQEEICPLMSRVEKQVCMQHDCAWFMRGVCAVKVIAGDQQGNGDE